MRSTFTRRRRLAAVVAAAAVPAAMLAMAPAANAANPTGSNYELFFEQSLTGDPANKITPGGFWGHEGAGRNQPTTIAADLTDGGGAFLNAFGIDDPGKLQLVFVPTSANGSAEEPTITPGMTVADAYPYFTDFGALSSFQGNLSNPNLDSVLTVSTPSEYNAWVVDGKPEQIISSTDLVSHDGLRAGNPVSVAPKGKSVLNRWPAGTNVSAVFVKTTGAFDADGRAILDASSGHAEAAWIPFTTAVDPAIGATSGIATSGAYNLAVAPATATTTTLAVTPTSPQADTATLTLTATVSPAAAGTVTFKDGTTTVGSAAVSGGTAAITTSLPAGTHSLTAEFVSADAATFAHSTSSAVSFTTTHNVTATSTVLTVPSGTFTAGDVVALSAAVTPAGIPGTVAFKDNGTTIGTDAVDASGVATFDWTSTVGGHSLTAVFTPDNIADFGASTSAPQTLTANPGGQFDTEIANIATDIDAGTIDISTPYTPANPLIVDGDPVLAGNQPLKLNTDNTMYVGSALFEHIVVTDTRAGGLPWHLVAQAGDLTSGTNAINGQNVGLTGLELVSGNGAGGATYGVTMTNNPAGAALAVGAPGNAGLGGGLHAVLDRVAPGTGAVEYKGTLTIQAPTSTQAGHYTGTVTFTVS
ncbi:Ig-like domain-containing protein [Nocardioides sp. WS12]|uniref:Ig-like domain-containing protein n=1 Tax=Nocardioides sp. WS12 TaxID=2486272 RepID=UPI0015FDA288|nr:Ig-like domain-containing protein [Nocardioides sp. WS12]